MGFRYIFQYWRKYKSAPFWDSQGSFSPPSPLGTPLDMISSATILMKLNLENYSCTHIQWFLLIKDEGGRHADVVVLSNFIFLKIAI